MLKIGIIGYGASAIGLIESLKNRDDIKITVFEKGKDNVTSFADLKMKKTTKCKGSASQDIKSDALARELYRIANLILQKHNESKVHITEFLENMFTINPGTLEVTGIKESVLILGQSGLDLFTRQARELIKENMLVCENLFQQGVKVWENDPTNQEPVEKAPTNDTSAQDEAIGQFRGIVAKIRGIIEEEKKLPRGSLSEEKQREYKERIKDLISQLQPYIQTLLDTGTSKETLREQLKEIGLEDLVPIGA